MKIGEDCSSDLGLARIKTQLKYKFCILFVLMITFAFFIFKSIYLNSLTHAADFKKEYIYLFHRNLRVLSRHQ